MLSWTAKKLSSWARTELVNSEAAQGEAASGAERGCRGVRYSY